MKRDGLANREALILEHLGRVRSIARRIHQKLPPHIAYEDLVSAGILGLIQAVDNFDPARDAQLSTYAEFKIRGAILDSLRREDWLPRVQRKRAKEIEAAILNAQQKLQRTPSEEEIAGELGVPLTEYQAWLSDLQSLHLACTESASGEGMLELLPDDEENAPSHIVERKEMEAVLASEIERLPDLERKVLMLYYQRDLAPHEIAQVIQIKATRVSQIRCQAIARLRANLKRRLAGATRRS